jgi:hypothetical protein
MNRVLTAEMSADAAVLISSAAGLPPRRDTLLKTLGGGAKHVNPIDLEPKTPRTWFIALPLEGPFTEVALGFSGLYNYPWSISSATVFASQHYGKASELPFANHLQIVPEIGDDKAVGTKVTFKGADSLSISPNAENPNNLAQPFEVIQSDFVACKATPRTDAGPGYLLFIYITVGTNGFVGTGSDFLGFSTDKCHNRQRPVWIARADEAGDFSNAPWETTWNHYPSAPLFSVAYRTQNRGIQIFQTGDSLSVGYHAYSNSLLRAANELSKPELPIELANFAWGGGNASIYIPFASVNAKLSPPSILAMQLMSRNDGHGVFAMQNVLKKNMEIWSDFAKKYDTKPLLMGRVQEPWDEIEDALDGYLALAVAISHFAENGIPVLDCAAIIGDPDHPWRYRQEFTDDGVHPNNAGYEAMVAQTKLLLAAVVGIAI